MRSMFRSRSFIALFALASAAIAVNLPAFSPVLSVAGTVAVGLGMFLAVAVAAPLVTPVFRAVKCMVSAGLALFGKHLRNAVLHYGGYVKTLLKTMSVGKAAPLYAPGSWRMCGST